MVKYIYLLIKNTYVMIQFKPFLFLFSLILFALASCSSSDAKNETVDDLDSSNNTEEVAVSIEFDIKDYVPKLDSITAKEKAVNTHLREYAELVLNPDKITTEEQLIEIFKMQDELSTELSPIIEQAFFETEEAHGYEAWDMVEDELNSIGLQGVYAEGMLFAVTRASVLEDKIEEIASDEYKLLIEFETVYSNSRGGEYPFAGLSGEADMLRIGELMSNKFPDSQYNKTIEERYFEALNVLTDIHLVTDDNEFLTYTVFETSTDFYPFMTEMQDREDFVKNNPESKFNTLFKNIIENVSTINTNDEGGYDKLYIIKNKLAETREKANELVNSYLLDGIDIPHSIPVLIDDEEMFAIVYRFYTDKEKAEQALAKITETHPDFEIAVIDYDGNIIK
jgi:hypothetical protein